MRKDFLLEHENAEKILEEGWRLFQKMGYRGVTIDALCAVCKISKPTLYYYFQDKETLFVEVLQYRLEQFRAAAEGSGSLPERLQAVAEAILVSFETEYSTLLRDREHIKNPENLQKIRGAFHSGLFGPLNAIMQAGIERGELRQEEADVLTRIFLGMINNFIGRAGEMGDQNAALAQKLTTYFLEGARAA